MKIRTDDHPSPPPAREHAHYMHELLRWVEQRCRWSDLHAIGNSRLIRSSAIVPIVGYLIILNEHLAGYGQLLAGGDITWRLYALYVGLSSIGLASMLYAARCPETIMSYRTAVEYTLKEDDYFLAGNNFTYVRDSARLDYGQLPQWKKGYTRPDRPRFVERSVAA